MTSPPYAVLFTQSKVVAKSRTARFVADQFRSNPEIDTFVIEINERDAFSAMFAMGGSLRSMSKSDVNNLEAAQSNVQEFVAEVIEKLRANREAAKAVA